MSDALLRELEDAAKRAYAQDSRVSLEPAWVFSFVNEQRALKARLTALEGAAKQVLYQISTDGDVQQACADLAALLTNQGDAT